MLTIKQGLLAYCLLHTSQVTGLYRQAYYFIQYSFKATYQQLFKSTFPDTKNMFKECFFITFSVSYENTVSECSLNIKNVQF